jgi:hypothetical protein
VQFSFQQLRMLECCASIISTLLLPARRHAYRPLLLRLKPLPDIVRWVTLLAPHLKAPTRQGPPISLVRLATGELSSLVMMKLCAAAAEGLPPLDRSPAELALLRGLIAPLLLLLTDAAQPAPHMLACALWGMARIRPLRAAMVEAGAVAALVTVADRLLNEAKSDAKSHAASLRVACSLSLGLTLKEG